MVSFFFIIASLFSNAEIKTNYDYRTVAVKITNFEQTSGGSGTVLSSGKVSTILTNSHVCATIEQGGFVVRGKHVGRIIRYKHYTLHDLCLVQAATDFGVKANVSKVSPKPGDESIVSGFPMLRPNITTRGHISDNLIAHIMVGSRPCEKEEFLTEPMCFFFGQYPIIQAFNSTYSSNLIQPGNSGSGVFNSKGELTNVVFAGSGDLSFGLLVPYSYVIDFITSQHLIEWVEPSILELQIEEEGELDMFEKVKFQCKNPITFVSKKVRTMCRNVVFDSLYRGN